MSDVEGAAELDEWSWDVAKMLVAELGESPEAVRGAGEVVAMLNAVALSVTRRSRGKEPDLIEMLAMQLAVLDKLRNMLLS